MTFQDPTTGDSLTSASASVPPLMGYGADSTLYPPSGSDVTASGGRGTSGAGFVGAQMSEHPAETEETPPEGAMDVFEATTWNTRRAGLIAGVVVAGLAAGAGIAWLVISRRRASILAAQAAELAQGRSLLSPAVARQRISDALESGADLSARAWQSARDLGIAASALAESALSLAQDARDRATQASQLMRDQTVSASQTAQDRISDTWGRTRDTAT
ncbi:MAG TPA: hypothetical protein VF725_06175, partial [Ktedonobacterales bacterium]